MKYVVTIYNEHTQRVARSRAADAAKALEQVRLDGLPSGWAVVVEPDDGSPLLGERVTVKAGLGS